MSELRTWIWVLLVESELCIWDEYLRVNVIIKVII